VERARIWTQFFHHNKVLFIIFTEDVQKKGGKQKIEGPRYYSPWPYSTASGKTSQASASVAGVVACTRVLSSSPDRPSTKPLVMAWRSMPSWCDTSANSVVHAPKMAQSFAASSNHPAITLSHSWRHREPDCTPHSQRFKIYGPPLQ
jgi:hypothetical protein